MAKQAVVPFITAHEGSGRTEARIVGRALARAGYGQLSYATRIRKKWDPRLSTLLGNFERDHGLKPKTDKSPTKVYSTKAHQKLARYYDRFNLQMAAELTAESAEDKLRSRVVSELMYFYNHRYETPYRQWRPWSRLKPSKHNDCSGSKGWADERAGAPTLGTPWGYGNTYSQLEHYKLLGRVIVWGHGWSKWVKVGDPVYYGSPSHVTVIVSIKNGVVKVFSFGSYPAKILDMDYRGDRGWICSLLGERNSDL